MKVSSSRIKKLNSHEYTSGNVLYWLSRDQRIEDNWALLHAQELAEQTNSTLIVCFCLLKSYLNSTINHYNFVLEGLKELELELKKYNIPFKLLLGEPKNEIPNFIKNKKIGALIADFSPLNINKNWKNSVANKINIPFVEVDTHNIIPVWITSEKQEYGAYTIRPKIKRLLNNYLLDIPKLSMQNKHNLNFENDWDKAYKFIQPSSTQLNESIFKPGENAANKLFKQFIDNNAEGYNHFRNDPVKDAQSQLSPYIHFGQISTQRIALEILNSDIKEDDKEAFLEQIIVRKELADNYCYYNNNYDNIDGFPNWAKDNLKAHNNDFRQYVYARDEFELAKTHDELWNAAQLQMMKTGKMHGYMRMYWAKKILEWSKSFEEAQHIAIYLNDKYELDGSDPNGYTGINWSIGALHDRPWKEREIFGKVRYMSYNGCKSKFDVNSYIKRWVQ